MAVVVQLVYSRDSRASLSLVKMLTCQTEVHTRIPWPICACRQSQLTNLGAVCIHTVFYWSWVALKQGYNCSSTARPIIINMFWYSTRDLADLMWKGISELHMLWMSGCERGTVPLRMIRDQPSNDLITLIVWSHYSSYGCTYTVWLVLRQLPVAHLMHCNNIIHCVEIY